MGTMFGAGYHPGDYCLARYVRVEWVASTGYYEYRMGRNGPVALAFPAAVRGRPDWDAKIRALLHKAGRDWAHGMASRPGQAPPAEGQ